MEDHSEGQHPLEDYWRVIWRRRWIIALVVSITTASVLAGSFIVTPIYEASAILRIKGQKSSVLGSDILSYDASVLSSREEINTQIEILKSRSVLEEVIDKLNLVRSYQLPEKLGAAERLLAALNRLKKDVSVSSVPNTQLIKIAVRFNDAELARDVANSLSQVFIRRNVESKRGEANAVLVFVSGQVDQVSEKLKAAEEDLLAYKQAEGIGVLDEEARLKVDRLAAIESSYQEARVQRQILDTKMKTLLGQMSPAASSSSFVASGSTTPVIRGMQSQLAELQAELGSLQQGALSDDQRTAGLRARIDSLENDIRTEVAGALKPERTASVDTALEMQLAEYQSQDIVLAAQESAWLKLIKLHEEGINELPSREINLIRLERGQRINEDLYAALMRAKNEAGIEAASQIGNIDIVDPAVTPLKPVRPNKEENAIIALVGSLFLALILSFLIEYLDKSVKSEDELKRLLGIPVLGIIPRFAANGRRNGQKTVKRRTPPLVLVTREQPNSPGSEAFRLLRANLRFLEVDRPLKTIMVTSPTPGDGKTTVAANLSMELAAQEERVLVVDADFKIPAVHRIFNLVQSPGISSVLSEDTNFHTVIRKVEGTEHLDIITAGPIPPNSSELLGSSRMKRLIEQLRDEYNRVIFDVPPVLAATDALDLASSLDGVLLVVKIGETDKRAIRRIREIFDTTPIRILGGILNGVDLKDSRYRYNQYYYHYHTGSR
jgi:succinoglycan biosynthesis transport protein ExoP